MDRIPLLRTLVVLGTFFIDSIYFYILTIILICVISVIVN